MDTRLYSHTRVNITHHISQLSVSVDAGETRKSDVQTFPDFPYGSNYRDVAAGWGGGWLQQTHQEAVEIS